MVESKKLIRNVLAVCAIVFMSAVLCGAGCSNVAGGSGGSNEPNSINEPNIWMCDHEVTQKEWDDVMGDLNTRKDKPTVSWGKGDDYPMYFVSWYDALVYCNKLSMKENKTPCYAIEGKTNPSDWGTIPTGINAAWNNATCNFDADGYRLPTEAEWEYMAKGGENYKYSGSDNIDDVAWYYNNSERRSHEVKTKNPNAYGMYDMSGNVWEWCWDLRTTWFRAIRGGSWREDETWSRMSWRDSKPPSDRYFLRGFRVVRRR